MLVNRLATSDWDNHDSLFFFFLTFVTLRRMDTLTLDPPYWSSSKAWWSTLSVLVLPFLFGLIFLFMLYVYDLVLVLVCIIFLKSNKIFDFKSGDSTFYKAIEKRGDVSSMQLICMTKQRKQILPQKTERYKTKINK